MLWITNRSVLRRTARKAARSRRPRAGTCSPSQVRARPPPARRASSGAARESGGGSRQGFLRCVYSSWLHSPYAGSLGQACPTPSWLGKESHRSDDSMSWFTSASVAIAVAHPGHLVRPGLVASLGHEIEVVISGVHHV